MNILGVQWPKWTKVKSIGTKMNLLKEYGSKWTKARTVTKIIFKPIYYNFRLIYLHYKSIWHNWGYDYLNLWAQQNEYVSIW